MVAVHSGYKKYREALLENGVALWELKPLARADNKRSLFGSSGASLHTKALVIDGQGTFVGSYNLDPRSTALNTEQGVFVRSDTIGEKLQELFAEQSSAQHAWRLDMRDSKVVWIDGERLLTSEPEAGFIRRALSTVLGWLPLERQL